MVLREWMGQGAPGFKVHWRKWREGLQRDLEADLACQGLGLCQGTVVGSWDGGEGQSGQLWEQ